MNYDMSNKRIPTGPAAAVLLASGIGSLVLGLVTLGGSASSSFKSFLGWYGATGSLSGKVGIAVIVWLLAWWALNNQWKEKEVALTPIFMTTLGLVALGMLFTFPPIFELFG